MFFRVFILIFIWVTQVQAKPQFDEAFRPSEKNLDVLMAIACASYVNIRLPLKSQFLIHSWETKKSGSVFLSRGFCGRSLAHQIGTPKEALIEMEVNEADFQSPKFSFILGHVGSMGFKFYMSRKSTFDSEALGNGVSSGTYLSRMTMFELGAISVKSIAGLKFLDKALNLYESFNAKELTFTSRWSEDATGLKNNYDIEGLGANWLQAVILWSQGSDFFMNTPALTSYWTRNAGGSGDVRAQASFFYSGSSLYACSNFQESDKNRDKISGDKCRAIWKSLKK
jgi:hypothetical protein